LNKVKKRTEFSKGLVKLVAGLFVFTVLFCLVMWILRNDFPQEILTIVAAPFSIVVTGYFGKAGYENAQKIRGTYEPPTYTSYNPNSKGGGY
jgi:hypothetical protein